MDNANALMKAVRRAERKDFTSYISTRGGKVYVEARCPSENEIDVGTAIYEAGKDRPLRKISERLSKNTFAA